MSPELLASLESWVFRFTDAKVISDKNYDELSRIIASVDENAHERGRLEALGRTTTNGVGQVTQERCESKIDPTGKQVHQCDLERGHPLPHVNTEQNLEWDA